MKRILPLITLLFTLFLLVGCNETIPNENSITLKMEEKFYEYIDSDIPDFTFNFKGNLNTIKEVNKPYYTVFSGNEDDILSDALTELFTKYKDRTYIELVDTSNVKQRKYSHLDENGKLYNVNMTVDDEKVYDETAYIDLENGLKLTVDYCRFVSEGKTYYTWRYSSSIKMYLYYPLMAIDDNGSRKIVIITLPNGVKFKISPEQNVSGLITKDNYLDPKMYVFSYFENDLDGNFDKKQYVLDYYKNYNLLEVEGKDNFYTFEYLNNKFNLELQDDSFAISWISKIK